MAHDIEGLTAAAICDAVAKRHDHRAHILDLITPTPGDVLFGRAATIRFFPNRRDHHSSEDRFDQLLSAVAGTGQVLVLGCGGHEDEALAGGKKVARIDDKFSHKPSFKVDSGAKSAEVTYPYTESGKDEREGAEQRYGESQPEEADQVFGLGRSGDVSFLLH